MVNPDVDQKSVLVFGAGGRLGSRLVTSALRRGLHVRAVLHRTNHFTEQPRLQVVRADVRDAATLTELFIDVDVVLASLGSAGASPPDVAGTGAEVITDLMSRHGLRRLVTVTGSGAVLPGERRSPWHALKRSHMSLGAPGLLADGDRHLSALASSDVEWTAVRVPLMTRYDRHVYSLDAAAPNPASTLPYHAAAAAMLDLITSPRWHKAAPFIHPA